MPEKVRKRRRSRKTKGSVREKLSRKFRSFRKKTPAKSGARKAGRTEAVKAKNRRVKR